MDTCRLSVFKTITWVKLERYENKLYQKNAEYDRRGFTTHHGDFWIGTYEKYQEVASQKPGQIQRDNPTGTLTSIPFEIVGDRIAFLIGGGRHPDSVYVALVVDGREVLKANGNNSESMQRHVWEVTPHKGKSA